MAKRSSRDFTSEKSVDTFNFALWDDETGDQSELTLNYHIQVILVVYFSIPNVSMDLENCYDTKT